MRKAVIVLMIAAVVCTAAFALTACNATPDGIADRFEDLAADGKFEVKRGTAGESAVYDFGRQVTVNTLVLKEVRDAVTSFRLYADDSEEPFYGNDYIGGYRYCSFDEITLSKLRIEVLSCEKLWQMKSVEAYNISGTDPEDDFRIMGYVTVESAVAMGEEHNANLDAATHLNLIGNIYFTSVSDIVFDDITLKSGEKMDGEEAFALAVEKMRAANPDGKLIVTFLGNKDLTGDGLEIEDRHNEAMGEHKDKLIAGIVAVVKKYSLDGVSFDYEYPHKLKSYTVYEEFLAGMRAAVDALPGDILLTAAICDWQLTPAMFTVKDLEVFDFVEVMAYDCFDKRGDHSTFYTACYEQLRKFERKGFDLSRLDLGLPYYSRPVDGAEYWGNYYDVAEELYPFGNSYVEAYTDLYGNSFPPLRNYYNGPQLIRDKTAYAIDCGAGGVMLWHLGTDSTDPTYSLTQLIARVKASR